MSGRPTRRLASNNRTIGLVLRHLLLRLLGTGLVVLRWLSYTPSRRLVIRMTLAVQRSWCVWDVAMALITHVRHGIPLVVHVHGVHGVVPLQIRRIFSHWLSMHVAGIGVAIRLLYRSFRDEGVLLDVLAWRRSEMTSWVQMRIELLWYRLGTRQKIEIWFWWHCSMTVSSADTLLWRSKLGPGHHRGRTFGHLDL